MGGCVLHFIFVQEIVQGRSIVVGRRTRTFPGAKENSPHSSAVQPYKPRKKTVRAQSRGRPKKPVYHGIQGGGKNAVAGIGKKCGKMRKKCGKCEKKCGIKCGFAKML